MGLGYRNPHLDPFAEFQRWKQHSAIRELLAGGQRISYGARAVNKGGSQSLPKLTFPGGLLVGCEAGFLNPAKIKGSHTAMKSGMLAAESIFAALALDGAAADAELDRYAERVRASWLWDELHRGRNFSAGIAKLGTFVGGALAFVEQNLLSGRAPWTLHNRVEDHARLREAAARRARSTRSRTASWRSIARAPCSCRARRTRRTSRVTSCSRIRPCRSP